MSKKVLVGIAIIIIVVGIWLLLNSDRRSALVNPQTSTPTPTPTPTPPQVPKTFRFDSATDLKMELDKVSPEVLDSDFE